MGCPRLHAGFVCLWYYNAGGSDQYSLGTVGFAPIFDSKQAIKILTELAGHGDKEAKNI